MQIARLFKPSLPIAALRMLMAVVFLLHAVTRIYNNVQPYFGLFLQEKGIPFGYYLAWAITLFELAGSVLLFIRIYVRWFCIIEILILIAGIITGHWQIGWLVMGIAVGGLGYSLILISILLAIYLAERKAEQNIASFL